MTAVSPGARLAPRAAPDTLATHEREGTIGPTLELRPAVLASIPAGTETTWHLVATPFKEFWVIA